MYSQAVWAELYSIQMKLEAVKNVSCTATFPCETCKELSAVVLSRVS